jgi:hypothetical protein
MDSPGSSLGRAACRMDSRSSAFLACRAGKGRAAFLPRSARLLTLVWLALVLAPLATVGGPALMHAALYLAPALLFLVPLCFNRDPAGRLLVSLARPRRRVRAMESGAAGSLLAAVRNAVVWTTRGGLLIGLAHAGRAPPAAPLPAVLARRR